MRLTDSDLASQENRREPNDHDPVNKAMQWLRLDVALSLRDRDAERFTGVVHAIKPHEPIQVLHALGCPVAERQGYFHSFIPTPGQSIQAAGGRRAGSRWRRCRR
jgi:hypothetical protein